MICLLIVFYWSGEIASRVITRVWDEQQKDLTFLVGGFDFGERALITNEPRSATVMTTMPTDLLVVGREVFSR